MVSFTKSVHKSRLNNAKTGYYKYGQWEKQRVPLFTIANTTIIKYKPISQKHGVINI